MTPARDRPFCDDRSVPGTADLDLFPRPRTVEPIGPGVAATSPVRVEVDPALPEQGYEIAITGDQVRITHADDAGLRYAEATLGQIRAQAGDELPGVRIADAPDFTTRGYMLDVSRDRVPTRATLERLVGLCALARINHLELYTEHTYAYLDHEVVWRDASPMTADDVMWLDALCALHGIALVANQNCFGHMGRWLAHRPYREWAECPDGFEPVAGYHMEPTVLAPTPANAAFAQTLFAELLPSFRSRRVNIGCDETFDLGHGVSRDEVARLGKERVYVDHLRRLVEPLAADGYAAHYWADIVRKEPALAAALPASATPVCWTYEAPGPGVRLPEQLAGLLVELGVDLPDRWGFDENTAPLAAAGVPFWVAPGTSAWDSLVGRIDNAVGNLVDAAEVGRARRAAGYLITDWGDNGHLQPPSVSFGPLLYGGAVSWGRDANADLDVAALLDRHAFDDRSARLGAAVVALGRQWGRTGIDTANGSPLQAALLPPTVSLAAGGMPDAAAVRDVLARIDQAIDDISRAEPRCADGPLVVAELAQAARLARHGAWRLLARVDGDAPSVDALRVDLTEAIADQRTAWLARARPGGLSDSIGRLERTLEEYDPA